MTTTSHHYERLLAAHYTWMLGGDITTMAAEQAQLLSELGIAAEIDARAIDLGCGPGPQSLALARLGFASVVSVDTSQVLLDELAHHAHRAGYSTTITPLCVDIDTALGEYIEPESTAVVVCMGDTLTHLGSKADVAAMLRRTAHCLVPGGHLVLTYRDLTSPLSGTDRFIPVRADDDRIMTCFLEYPSPETVVVHDLIHTRTGGTWNTQVSDYTKLRITPAWVADRCEDAGLRVGHNADGPRGLRVIVARKPEHC